MVGGAVLAWCVCGGAWWVGGCMVGEGAHGE